METLTNTQRTGDTEPFVALVANYVKEELEMRIRSMELNEKNIREAKSKTTS
ncbi:MAG: hypothetical protein SOR80_03290 [Enterococcus cecorum]|nr:hypothetical protein [Enterococcus cecorum]